MVEVSALKTRPRLAFACDAGLEVVLGGQDECCCEVCVGGNVVRLVPTADVPERVLDLELV